MGTRGPLSKPTRNRARDQRRRDARAVVLDGAGRKAPPLPDAAKLPAIVREWWATLWASPLAAEFREVDEPALIRLVGLWADAVSGDASAALLSEMRQLEDRFGLNPSSRRRLDWRTPKPEADIVPLPVASRHVRAVERAQ